MSGMAPGTVNAGSAVGVVVCVALNAGIPPLNRQAKSKTIKVCKLQFALC